ncbi:MAG: hypothetical protein R3293_24050 [Candidatus Promineifilaceae bacterium]|nr:hypothetical protein [Candidatus Promineifilaceae bacterium]
MNQRETPRIRSLLRQADRNVESGKLAAAESLYRQIVDEAPESAAAWLGLAHVSRVPADKRAAYERVLALDANNSEALVGLSDLQDQSIVGPEITLESESQTQSVNRRPSDLAAEAQGGGDSQKQFSTNKGQSTAEVRESLIQNEAQDHDGHTHDTITHGKQASVFNPDVELVCYRHPDRNTSLRCYKCNKPICSECTVKTPVGYLCPSCHREAEDAFYNNKATDYLVAALVALPLSLIAGWLVVRFSGGIFMILLFIFAGGAVGGFIARLSKRAIGKRRGRFIPHVVAACIVIGVLFFAWPWLLVLFSGAGGALFKLAGIGVYLFTAASSAYYWAR